MSLWVNPHSVTTQIKAAEQYFILLLFIMLYEVVLTESLWTKYLDGTIPMKAIEQHLPVNLLIMFYKQLQNR